MSRLFARATAVTVVGGVLSAVALAPALAAVPTPRSFGLQAGFPAAKPLDVQFADCILAASGCTTSGWTSGSDPHTGDISSLLSMEAGQYATAHDAKAKLAEIRSSLPDQLAGVPVTAKWKSLRDNYTAQRKKHRSTVLIATFVVPASSDHQRVFAKVIAVSDTQMAGRGRSPIRTVALTIIGESLQPIPASFAKNNYKNVKIQMRRVVATGNGTLLSGPLSIDR